MDHLDSMARDHYKPAERQIYIGARETMIQIEDALVTWQPVREMNHQIMGTIVTEMTKKIEAQEKSRKSKEKKKKKLVSEESEESQAAVINKPDFTLWRGLSTTSTALTSVVLGAETENNLESMYQAITNKDTEKDKVASLFGFWTSIMRNDKQYVEKIRRNLVEYKSTVSRYQKLGDEVIAGQIEITFELNQEFKGLCTKGGILGDVLLDHVPVPHSEELEIDVSNKVSRGILLDNLPSVLSDYQKFKGSMLVPSKEQITDLIADMRSVLGNLHKIILKMWKNPGNEDQADSEELLIHLEEEIIEWFVQRKRASEDLNTIIKQLNKHQAKTHKARTSGRITLTIGYMLDVIGGLLIPVTFGGSIGLMAAGISLSVAGHGTDSAALVMHKKLTKELCESAVEILNADNEKVIHITELLRDFKACIKAAERNHKIYDVRDSLVEVNDEELGDLRIIPVLKCMEHKNSTEAAIQLASHMEKVILTPALERNLDELIEFVRTKGPSLLAQEFGLAKGKLYVPSSFEIGIIVHGVISVLESVTKKADQICQVASVPGDALEYPNDIPFEHRPSGNTQGFTGPVNKPQLNRPVPKPRKSILKSLPEAVPPTQDPQNPLHPVPAKRQKPCVKPRVSIKHNETEAVLKPDPVSEVSLILDREEVINVSKEIHGEPETVTLTETVTVTSSTNSNRSTNAIDAHAREIADIVNVNMVGKASPECTIKLPDTEDVMTFSVENYDENFPCSKTEEIANNSIEINFNPYKVERDKCQFEAPESNSSSTVVKTAIDITNQPQASDSKLAVIASDPTTSKHFGLVGGGIDMSYMNMHATLTANLSQLDTSVERKSKSVRLSDYFVDQDNDTSEASGESDQENVKFCDIRDRAKPTERLDRLKLLMQSLKNKLIDDNEEDTKKEQLESKALPDLEISEDKSMPTTMNPKKRIMKHVSSNNSIKLDRNVEESNAKTPDKLNTDSMQKSKVDLIGVKNLLQKNPLKRFQDADTTKALEDESCEMKTDEKEKASQDKDKKDKESFSAVFSKIKGGIFSKFGNSRDDPDDLLVDKSQAYTNTDRDLENQKGTMVLETEKNFENLSEHNTKDSEIKELRRRNELLLEHEVHIAEEKGLDCRNDKGKKEKDSFGKVFKKIKYGIVSKLGHSRDNLDDLDTDDTWSTFEKGNENDVQTDQNTQIDSNAEMLLVNEEIENKICDECVPGNVHNVGWDKQSVSDVDNSSLCSEETKEVEIEHHKSSRINALKVAVKGFKSKFQKESKIPTGSNASLDNISLSFDNNCCETLDSTNSNAADENKIHRRTKQFFKSISSKLQQKEELETGLASSKTSISKEAEGSLTDSIPNLNTTKDTSQPHHKSFLSGITDKMKKKSRNKSETEREELNLSICDGKKDETKHETEGKSKQHKSFVKGFSNKFHRKKIEDVPSEDIHDLSLPTKGQISSPGLSPFLSPNRESINSKELAYINAVIPPIRKFKFEPPISPNEEVTNEDEKQKNGEAASDIGLVENADDTRPKSVLVSCQWPKKPMKEGERIQFISEMSLEEELQDASSKITEISTNPTSIFGSKLARISLRKRKKNKHDKKKEAEALLQ